MATQPAKYIRREGKSLQVDFTTGTNNKVYTDVVLSNYGGTFHVCVSCQSVCRLSYLGSYGWRCGYHIGNNFAFLETGLDGKLCSLAHYQVEHHSTRSHLSPLSLYTTDVDGMYYTVLHCILVLRTCRSRNRKLKQCACSGKGMVTIDSPLKINLTLSARHMWRTVSRMRR